MAERPTRTFTFTEANGLVPQLADMTEEAIQELDRIRRSSASESDSDGATLPDSAMKRVEETLQGWSQRVVELGGLPKGYFTVDFPSLDPELLYCWTYGEDKISFTHKIWENFSHRRPLVDSTDVTGGHLKWLN